MAEATRIGARRALDRIVSRCAGDPTVASDVDVLRTVLDSAGAVMRFGNPEGTDLEAETPIEDWALDALAIALIGRSAQARRLMDQYWYAPWDAEHDGHEEGARYRSDYRASLDDTDHIGASNA